MKKLENQIPVEITRMYRAMPLSKRKVLYRLVREELNYGDNPDNSNIRKMLRGQRNVTPQVVKILSDYLGIGRQKGNIQMDLLDIVKLGKYPQPIPK